MINIEIRCVQENTIKMFWIIQKSELHSGISLASGL